MSCKVSIPDWGELSDLALWFPRGNIVDVFVVTIVLKCLGESWVWADVS